VAWAYENNLMGRRQRREIFTEYIFDARDADDNATSLSLAQDEQESCSFAP
jgi:hypothetical protein